MIKSWKEYKNDIFFFLIIPPLSYALSLCFISTHTQYQWNDLNMMLVGLLHGVFLTLYVISEFDFFVLSNNAIPLNDNFVSTIGALYLHFISWFIHIVFTFSEMLLSGNSKYYTFILMYSTFYFIITAFIAIIVICIRRLRTANTL